VAAAGAAEENPPVVAHELAAAARENRRQAGQARAALLADAGRGSHDAATVWKHGAADRLAALASRVGQPTTGSDFCEERGSGAAKCRKYGWKGGRLGPLGFSREARMAPSVARESTLHCKLDSQVHGAAVRSISWVAEKWIMEIPVQIAN